MFLHARKAAYIFCPKNLKKNLGDVERERIKVTFREVLKGVVVSMEKVSHLKCIVILPASYLWCLSHCLGWCDWFLDKDNFQKVDHLVIALVLPTLCNLGLELRWNKA